MTVLRVATRGSRLARTQTRSVCTELRAAHPDLEFEEIVVRTSGDRDHSSELAEMSRAAGIGFFVREVEAAVLDGRADFAVHSLKDLPVEERDDLLLAAVPMREDPRDALAPAPGPSDEANPLERLPAGSVIGTGSPRRAAQCLAFRSDIEVRPVRGNVPTRLEKARARDGLDVVILALAGLRRLGLASEAAPIPEDVIVPAPGQGALGVQCRIEDPETRSLLARIEDTATRAAVTAERAFLRRLQGGCALPAGALATVVDGALRIKTRVAALDGRTVLDSELSGPLADPGALGTRAAEALLEAGAAELLEDA